MEEIIKRGGWIFLFKINKRDSTFIREMRVVNNLFFLNCSSKKEMVPITEDTEIVISLPSPIPKEEELLSTTDISTTDFCPIDENNSSSYPNSNRTSLISQASTVSRASVISEKWVLLLIF